MIRFTLRQKHPPKPLLLFLKKIKEKFKRTYIAEKHPLPPSDLFISFLEAVLNFFGK